MRVCGRCGADYDDKVRFCPVDGTHLSDGDPALGTLISGKYELLEPLGKGGFGVVYKARQHPIDRLVALKLLHPNFNTDEQVTGRFINEAKVVCKLRDPHTVTVFDFGELPNGQLYLVMEFIEGTLLTKEMGTPHSVEQALDIIDQMAASLAEAHEKGIVHRDLKPDNVMVEQLRGQTLVRVLDFGIASLTQSTTKLTQPGTILGTPVYMSPEQARGRQVGPGSDIYSLGVLLYQLIAGRAPFVADSIHSLLFKHVNEQPPPFSDLNVEVPQAITDLVWRLMAKDPADRPPDAGALQKELVALRRVLEGGQPAPAGAEHAAPDRPSQGVLPIEVAPTPPTTTEVGELLPGRGPLGVVLIVAAALLIAAGAWIAWPQPESSEGASARAIVRPVERADLAPVDAAQRPHLPDAAPAARPLGSARRAPDAAPRPADAASPDPPKPAAARRAAPVRRRAAGRRLRLVSVPAGARYTSDGGKSWQCCTPKSVALKGPKTIVFQKNGYYRKVAKVQSGQAKLVVKLKRETTDDDF